MESQCPDCGATVPVPDDATNDEIVSCPCCGLELKVHIEIDGVSLSEITIDGEDWGE